MSDRAPTSIHQPANPVPDVSVPSHPTVQSFKTVCWREGGRWRVGQVGEADREHAVVWPFDGDQQPITFTGEELEGLRVKPPGAPSQHPRH